MVTPARRKKASKTSPYSLHPSYRLMDGYRKSLEKKTGRSFESWVEFARKNGPAEVNARRDWLRNDHGLSINYATWVAGGEDWSAESYDPASMVDALFAGKRAGLRPVYDALLAAGLALADDVKACPCQTMVPLYRRYAFAEIKPTTNTSIDLGLALGTETPSGRLERLSSRAAGNRITHRIRITDAGQIDAFVGRWLRAAYELGNEERERSTAATATRPPADLAKALKASPKATATWQTLTPRMKADWVELVEQAAKPETRRKRVTAAIARLAAGKKRMY